ncbi:MAG TPA: transcription-repair coupling factor [Ruminococcaceae bacterium]|nr:transcription-repair coupling factor [Oscillospiraceae bacterium]
MQFLFDILKKEPEYKRLLSAVKNDKIPLAVSGLAAIHKALLTASISRHTGKKVLMITHDEATAYNMCGDLSGLGIKAVHLPLRDYDFTSTDGRSKDYEYRRIDTLSKVIGGGFDVVTASVDCAVCYTVPKEILQRSIIRITSKSSIETEEFCQKLVECGYVKAGVTDGKGMFSVRGGIIDVFPTNRETPVRIELWGDDIDNLSEYDAFSQRRTVKIDEFEIYPANELSFNRHNLCEKLNNYLENGKKLTDAQRDKLEKDIYRLDSALPISTDAYIPFLYDKMTSVFDYFSDAVTVVCDTANVIERLKDLEDSHNEDIKLLMEEGTLSKETAGIYLKKTDFLSGITNAVFFESFPKTSYFTPLKGLFSFDFKRLSPWGGDLGVLIEDISYMSSTGGTVVILASETKAASVLCEELRERGVKATVSFDKMTDAPGVYVCKGGLSSGFELPFSKFMLITNRHLPGESVKRKRLYKKGQTIGSLDELKRGDYVVHASYGIGIFDGISQIKKQSVIKDYIKIKYAGSDNLYIPVTQLDMVSKYIGAAEDSGIKLNKLGTQSWSNTKKRVKSAVKDMAKQLTKLYAKRMATKGYAFGRDTDLQNNFERRFEYEETEDQLQCVNEIKRDMERPVPMDRLLCGDVGFGKTEVALRAAFKCISEGKQCAFLVPTTILAMQHYNTILSRIGDLPVEIKLLNRFVPKKEQARIVSGLKAGSVDMVVGTHRLISKDVAFKDIGLVIIDEEQRFGVAQKEKLKELYPFVDILTLSATPIPRTLNMAMSGLRDMSSIDEAPADRYPVQTYVLEQNNAVIKEAINKELRRGGQVYYLHNRVESIVNCAARIMNMLPSARVGIAHGKMSEDELSDIWQKLIDREIDILVCTTIIETGVDVPNCNTLIIENSDRFGLAQLHQLRGRVGRSSRRAYAYFCYTKGKIINETAQKRLEAIREFTQFGSGFKIAMRDLEIRGAGSILGGEQHGNMEAVGYDMYLRMLNEAVNEENGIEKKTAPECTVDLDISAHIPENYIDSLPARLGIYKRIAGITNSVEASDVIDELCDRFGEPPSSVMGLIDIALLRSRSANAGIYEIISSEKGIILKTDRLRDDTVKALSEYFKSRLTFAVTGTPAYIIKPSKDETPARTVKELSDIL